MYMFISLCIIVSYICICICICIQLQYFWVWEARLFLSHVGHVVYVGHMQALTSTRYPTLPGLFSLPVPYPEIFDKFQGSG